MNTLYENIQENNLLTIIAGPCAVEGRDMALEICEELKTFAEKYNFNLIFKGSYKKANRTRIDSFTGIGDENALGILDEIRTTYNVPVLTDIHESKDAQIAANYVDVLQIPAFLARQTDLLVAAAETGKIINIKKGQFMSPNSMEFAVQKVKEYNNKVLLTERGSMFGYGDLVVDFRGIPIMKSYAPVIFDATHSLQQPNTLEGVTGGRPELIGHMAHCAIAAGVNGIFIETHPRPELAKSDGKNMLKLSEMEKLVKSLVELYLFNKKQ